MRACSLLRLRPLNRTRERINLALQPRGPLLWTEGQTWMCSMWSKSLLAGSKSSDQSSRAPHRARRKDFWKEIDVTVENFLASVQSHVPTGQGWKLATINLYERRKPCIHRVCPEHRWALYEDLPQSAYSSSISLVRKSKTKCFSTFKIFWDGKHHKLRIRWEQTLKSKY